MRRALWLLGLCALLIWQGAGLRAQDVVLQSPILTIEPERFYTESAFGKRVAAEIEAERAAIAAENRRIEAELTEEEQTLTDQRPTMAVEEFRALAEVFDAKVTELRRAQDTKARALAQKTEENRRLFFVTARPVLGDMMREAGAGVILDRRSVFLAADVVDVTDEAIARIDQLLGADGAALAVED